MKRNFVSCESIESVGEGATNLTHGAGHGERVGGSSLGRLNANSRFRFRRLSATRRVASFFFKGSLVLHTLYFIDTALSTVATDSGSILGLGASHASPGISIERTAIVVVRTPYIWSYVSVLLYRWDFGLGNRTQSFGHTPRRVPSLLDLQFKVGSEPPGARKHLEKLHWCWPGFQPGPKWRRKYKIWKSLFSH